jgi:feruloyl esterase
VKSFLTELLAIAALAACAGATPNTAARQNGPAKECSQLVRTALPDPTTVIGSAVLQPYAPAPPLPVVTGGPPQLSVATPEHCEIFGRLQERQGANGQTYAIKFHLRLPTSWNGRFSFSGGGGTNGNIGTARGGLLAGQTSDALSLGYAVISQDSGHDNAVNEDPNLQGVVTFGWDAEARRNYGGASIGPVVRAGKALIRAYYGRDPRFTYFVGGSKGGQEGFMAIQRFADEFDAVLVGYPGFRLAYAGGVGQMWDAQAFGEAARAAGQMGADGVPLINRAMSDDDLLLVSTAVLKACDGLDETIDGMIENFPACTTARVTPALTAVICIGDKRSDCLALAQVDALRKVFNGARGKDGRTLYADWPWDAGIAARTAQGVTQGWRQWKMGSYASTVNNGASAILGGASASAVFTSPPTAVADSPSALTRYALSANVEDNRAKADAKWGAFNESAADFMNADSADLKRFEARGGKLLIFHGVSDPVFSINDTIAWLHAVDARERGRAGRFVRLFAVPGMNHGGGGPATDQFDAFGALVSWREKGVAPDSIVATARQTSPWPGRTRLLCPYPQQPRRRGVDIENAGSFHCVVP